MTACSVHTPPALSDVAACSRVLGALFYRSPDEPDVRPIVDLVASGNLTEAWPLGDPQAVQSAATGMQACLTEAGARELLVAEHQRLFFGPDHLEAPPWGSVYLEEEGTLFGESSQALRRFLASEGISLATGQEEPEDHIGLLLWAIALLAEEGRVPALRTLLERHVLTWSGAYLERLRLATAHPFYQGVATLAGLTLEAAAGDLD